MKRNEYIEPVFEEMELDAERILADSNQLPDINDPNGWLEW